MSLIDKGLATASTNQDIRLLIADEVSSAGAGAILLLGGQRFRVEPPMLMRIPANTGLLHPRYRFLTSQSLELLERECVRIEPNPPRADFREVASGPGRKTLTVVAEGEQFVNAGIEVRDGCISGIHFEQATAQERA
ncbi:hypothetical protein LZ009_13500 [Ramlibacter sp. XY19]|uniref:hypothetical protein n=1 Tax=Ramlibacter paludis TaxID=2908000 RepID=UPI0023DB632A|nr:hypothetical protein [Ramlibacter paludis]MCG2593795.1 hypothetical protein [Ramlibacter paludis]